MSSNPLRGPRKPASEKRSYARTKAPLQKAARKVVVEENAKLHAARSVRDQLALLDRRLGDGVGAKRERERLAAK